jgi:hypothetical protein
MIENTKKVFAVLARRKSVAAMYLRGHAQLEIAQRLGVNAATVCRDLAALRKEWREAAGAAFSARVELELARIDRLEQIAWEAWDRSCEDAEKSYMDTIRGKVDRKGKQLPDVQKVSQTKEGRYGDPRFLERVSWCIEQRCKIIGVGVPGHRGRGAASEEQEARRKDVREFFIKLREEFAKVPGLSDAMQPVLVRMVQENEERRAERHS